MLFDNYKVIAQISGEWKINPGDLQGAIMVKIQPRKGLFLPAVVIVDQEFIKHYFRRFKKVTIGGFDEEKHFHEVNKTARPERRARRLAQREEMKKKQPPKPKKATPLSDHCFTVVQTKAFRLCVNHASGEMVVVGPVRDLYI